MLVGGPDGTLDGGPEGILVGGPDGTLDGGPVGILVGGPDGTLDGGPDGTLDGGPAGTLVGVPVPEDPADELGVVGTVEGGVTVAQNSATVSFLAVASAVSCGKLSWALLEAPLVLVPLVAAAQAVHCPKALAPEADPPLPWLLVRPLALAAPRLACADAWLFGFGTEIPTSARPEDIADCAGAGSEPAAAAATPPPITTTTPAATVAILTESHFVSIRFFPS